MSIRWPVLGLALLLAASPLVAQAAEATPRALSLDGPTAILLGEEAVFQGELASRLQVGAERAMARGAFRGVEVALRLDGAPIATTKTDDSGQFHFTVALPLGDHEVEAVAWAGGMMETSSGTRAVRSYTLPGPVEELTASFNATVRRSGAAWLRATQDSWPPILGYRAERVAWNDSATTITVARFDTPGNDIGGMSFGDGDLRGATSYTYRVVAFTEMGEGAPSYASFATPRDMPDTLEVGFVRFEVCPDVGACKAAPDRGEVKLVDTANVTIRSTFQGFVTSPLGGVAGLRLEARHTLRDVALDPSIRQVQTWNFTTAADGAFSFTVENVVPATPGACKTYSVHQTAKDVSLWDFAYGDVRVCG